MSSVLIDMTIFKKCTFLFVLLLLLPSLLLYAGASEPGLSEQSQGLLDGIDLGDDIHVHTVALKNGELTLCLDMDTRLLSDENGLAVESLSDMVRSAVTPLDWQSLYVQVYDIQIGECRSLASYLHQWEPTQYGPEFSVPADDAFVRAVNNAAGSLAGKTVYISAGHGWHWTSVGWRTQRIVYQGFIEDHNNAEVVDQYLIPYLENAGAKVVPVRERDWNASRDIADNEDGGGVFVTTGTWTASELIGYNGSHYQWAPSKVGSANATATWNLQVDQTNDYAVYAWVKPGDNRVPDAHYSIHHAGGQADVYLDQRIGPETW
ncbi:MAG: hypothetical protein E4H27_05440, partial [Anaerolineales bacterium]